MSNVSIDAVNDLLWLKKRLSHVNESQIEFFLEKCAVLWDGGNGMPPQQARAASLILLIDHMRD